MIQTIKRIDDKGRVVPREYNGAGGAFAMLVAGRGLPILSTSTMKNARISRFAASQILNGCRRALVELEQ